MASIAYNGFKEGLLKGDFNMVTNDLRWLLIKSITTTPDNPDHEFVSDIAADEATHASYARQAAASKTVTRNNTANRAEFDCANPVFPSLDGDLIRGAILFRHTGSNSTARMCTLHDFADTQPDGSNFTLVVGADGAIHLT